MSDIDNEPTTSDGSNSNIGLSDEEELAIGRRWDPLGEEKDDNATLRDETLVER